MSRISQPAQAVGACQRVGSAVSANIASISCWSTPRSRPLFAGFWKSQSGSATNLRTSQRHRTRFVEQLRHTQFLGRVDGSAEELGGADGATALAPGKECACEVVAAPSGPAAGTHALVHVESNLMVGDGVAGAAERQGEQAEVSVDRAEERVRADDHTVAVSGFHDQPVVQPGS